MTGFKQSIVVAALMLAGLALPGAYALQESPAAEAELSAFDAIINDAKTSMMRDPVNALALAEQAAVSLQDDPEAAPEDFATAWWLQAEALTRQGRAPDALPVAQQALDALGDRPAPTKLYADILVALGRINRQTSEYGVALERFQSAYEVFRLIGESRSEAIVLQSIGSIYRDAHQHERAIEYFTNASERHPGDVSLELAATNNLGNAYRELERYAEALPHYQRAHEIAVEMESATLQARILSNIASLHVDAGDFEAADRALNEAFALLPERSDMEWIRFLYGIRAQIAYGREEYRAARFHMERAFDGLQLAGTTQTFKDFHQAAAGVYEALGEWSEAVPHLRAYHRLENESRAVVSSANLALMGAQFHFAEQELQIEQLRTTGLENALELEEARGRQRLLAAGGLLLVFIFVSLGLMWRQRAARERQILLEKSLYEDGETELPSRAALERQVSERAAERGRGVVVAALGVERFKHLEVVLGFAKTAELHQRIAERIGAEGEIAELALVSPGVIGLVARTQDIAVAGEEMDRLRRLFSRPVEVSGTDIDVALTAGVAVGEDGAATVRQAVAALEQSRVDGRSVSTFDAEKFGDADKNLSLMSRMMDATRDGAMTMHYQPKLNLRTGKFSSAEALCRWFDPQDGFIPPDKFIPLAEETGHIRELTEWTLRRAVSDRHLLSERGHEVEISVNISGALLCDEDFAELALSLVGESAAHLVFEITETAAMRNPDAAMRILESWVEAGIKLAIDDYGSGMSSLAYLKRLPASELKLDRAFVGTIETSERDRMLVKSTTDLAHGLGLEMTAEGVETDEGLALLKLFGCDWAQGWALSKARPMDSLIDFLDENRQARDIEVPESGASDRIRRA